MSCPSPLVYQNGVCSLYCSLGWKTASVRDNICQMCLDDCESCDPSLFQIDMQCVENCPIGMEPALFNGNQVCILTDITPILNPITIPQSIVSYLNDIYVNIAVTVPSTVTMIMNWTLLLPIPSQDNNKFFNGITTDSSIFIIPADNLTPGTVYTLQFIAQVGNKSSNLSFSFQTLEQISIGTMSVNPPSGISYETPFNIEFSGWTHPTDQVNFTIQSYIATQDPSGQILKTNLIFLAQNLPNTTNNFIFRVPPIFGTVQLTIELISFTQSLTESISTTIEVEPLDKSSLIILINTTNASTLTNPQEILTLACALNQLNDIDLALSNANNLIDNSIQVFRTLSSNLSFCLDDFDCTGNGTCSFKDGMIICNCYELYAGPKCQYMADNYNQIKAKIDIMVQNLLNFEVKNTSDILQVLGALSTLTNNTNYIDPTYAESFVNIVLKYFANVTIDNNSGQILLNIISNIKTLVGTNTSITASIIGGKLDNVINNLMLQLSNSMNSGGNLVISTPNMAMQTISPNDIFESDSNSISQSGNNRILQLNPFSSPVNTKYKTVSKSQLPKKITSKTHIGKKSFQIQYGDQHIGVPPLTLKAAKNILFKAKSQPASSMSGKSIGLLTSVTSLEISDSTNPIPINYSPIPFVFNIPKTAPTDPRSTPLVCSYYDSTSKNFKTDGCTKISETKKSIKCSCTHLTQFGATMLSQGLLNIKLSDLLNLQAESLSFVIKSDYHLKVQQHLLSAINIVYKHENKQHITLSIEIIFPIIVGISIFVVVFILHAKFRSTKTTKSSVLKNKLLHPVRLIIILTQNGNSNISADINLKQIILYFTYFNFYLLCVIIQNAKSLYSSKISNIYGRSFIYGCISIALWNAYYLLVFGPIQYFYFRFYLHPKLKKNITNAIILILLITNICCLIGENLTLKNYSQFPLLYKDALTALGLTFILDIILDFSIGVLNVIMPSKLLK